MLGATDCSESEAVALTRHQLMECTICVHAMENEKIDEMKLKMKAHTGNIVGSQLFTVVGPPEPGCSKGAPTSQKKSQDLLLHHYIVQSLCAPLLMREKQ